LNDIHQEVGVGHSSKMIPRYLKFDASIALLSMMIRTAMKGLS